MPHANARSSTNLHQEKYSSAFPTLSSQINHEILSK